MIRLITDSTADIHAQRAQQLNIDVVPLSVSFGDRNYSDGVDIDADTFYPLLESADKLPVTSQPAPDAFLPLFEQAKQEGNSVIALLVSSKISGTVQSAMIAKQLCGYEDIFIIDTLSAICGLRLLVEHAVRMRDAGADAQSIISMIEKMKSKVRILSMVDTMEYLHKGGRLSKGKLIIATALGIKPLVALKNGALEVVGQAKGFTRSVNAIMNHLTEMPPDLELPVYFGYTGKKENCEKFMDIACEHYAFSDKSLCPVGCVVGAHIGPGAFAIAYFAKE